MTTATIIVEFRNGGQSVINFRSDKPLNIDNIHNYLIDEYDFNESKDSFTIVDEPTEVVI